MNQERVPLAVDLDGTLLKGDMLLESANEYIARAPWRILALVRPFFAGRAALKDFLARRVSPDVSVLPYNSHVLSLLRDEHAKGRSIVLATASNHLLATRIADHLGVFDGVIASDEKINLKSRLKADELVRRYGKAGFDYIGNDAADLTVWSEAAGALVVSDSARFIRRVGADGQALSTSRRRGTARSVFAAMRPHQWAKNLLIFIPLVASHRFSDPFAIVQALAAFVLFSFVASAVYVLNDLVDVAQDRHHRRKMARPFASGDIGLWMGWLLWPTLLGLAVVGSLVLLDAMFLVVLLAYFVLTVGYSLVLKRRAIWDVLALAILYLSRLIAGAVAIQVEASFWLLGFAMFFFLSLALIKRYNELLDEKLASGTEKIRGRGYYISDLPLVVSLGPAAGYVAALIVALYVYDERTTSLYMSPQFLWLTVPPLLFWVSRAWLIAYRGEMHDDPVVFVIRDKTSYLVGAMVLAAFALASMVRLP